MTRYSLAVLVFGGCFMSVRSDEGMWLPNDPPRELLKNKYDFHLTETWYQKVIHASVRFNNGGSGGFVSPNGLIVTNHHIAADALQKLSTPESDLLRLGFYARSPQDEKRCPDLELNVLQSIEDVTDQVNSAVLPEMDAMQAFSARRAAMARIEKESLDRTGFRSDVVTLYNGGLYHLYRYKKYTDVRLVFAPESNIASFGGDVDNFEYPRHSLDVAFFRAYENDQPAQVEHYFAWSRSGPAEGDLVFVTGHPGTTQRLETVAKLKHRRDATLPYTLYRLRTMEAALSQYGDHSPEQRRQAATDHHRVANARKAFSGQLQGLLDPRILAAKSQQEIDMVNQLRQSGQETTAAAYLAAVERVAAIQQRFRPFEREYSLIERGDGFASELFTIARHLVRLADELPKPSADRLREYRDSNLESLKFQLFSPAPLYPTLERAKLTASLTFLAENLGGDHPVVIAVLASRNPANRASELVSETQLANVAVRKQLAEGGQDAIRTSTDPMIRLAKTIDAAARELRKQYEVEVEEPERQAYAEIAKARFRAYGQTLAPDATFTLRLAFGVVQGYEVDGQPIPYQTTMADAFQRAELQHHREPFEMPERWRQQHSQLNLRTPLNFVSTADTIGGNSGSPVLNRAGELVGVNFDRNRHGLVRNFVYTDVQARHIAVHGQAVIEALTNIYDASPLVHELMNR